MGRMASIMTVLVSVLLAGVARAEKIPNWPAPPTWSPAISGGWLTKSIISDLSAPLPFIPITPCRLADTRAGSGFPAGYGPPSIAGGGTQRTFTITGQCGIPTGAQAVSFNFAVWGPPTRGDLRVFPAGGGTPLVSTLNWEAGILALANAAVVPLGTGGAITLQVDGAGTVDIFFDVNGYYSGASASGQGMNLTASGSNNALTLNLTGTGDGLDIYTTTTGYSLWSWNYSTSCGSVCGGFFAVDSTTSGATALAGYAYGGTNRNVGVIGISYGKGTGFTFGTSAAGVLGRATNTGVAYAHGVVGQTASTNAVAAGVYGEATNSTANAGLFQNMGGGGIFTYIATTIAATAYGIDTNGQIYGTNGLVISGLPKSFATPHPEDPSKEIMYVAAEGPTSDVFFRGTARLRNGTAVIPVPDHFKLVAREGSYMTTVTSVGFNAGLFVEAEGAEGIVVRGSGNARFHYVVWGERDECKDHEAVRPNAHFTPDQLERANAVKTFPEPTRALLVKNGTLNPDGTYNRTTARRLGWNIPEPQPESVAAPIDTLEAKKK